VGVWVCGCVWVGGVWVDVCACVCVYVRMRCEWYERGRRPLCTNSVSQHTSIGSLSVEVTMYGAASCVTAIPSGFAAKTTTLH